MIVRSRLHPNKGLNVTLQVASILIGYASRCLVLLVLGISIIHSNAPKAGRGCENAIKYPLLYLYIPFWSAVPPAKDEGMKEVNTKIHNESCKDNKKEKRKYSTTYPKQFFQIEGIWGTHRFTFGITRTLRGAVAFLPRPLAAPCWLVSFIFIVHGYS